MTIKAILTDIEGTTTDINFVHKVLFPYAYDHLPGYLRSHSEDEVVLSVLEDARTELGHLIPSRSSNRNTRPSSDTTGSLAARLGIISPS